MAAVYKRLPCSVIRLGKVYDPTSIGSWEIKGTGESLSRRTLAVTLIQHDQRLISSSKRKAPFFETTKGETDKDAFPVFDYLFVDKANAGHFKSGAPNLCYRS